MYSTPTQRSSVRCIIAAVLSIISWQHLIAVRSSDQKCRSRTAAPPHRVRRPLTVCGARPGEVRSALALPVCGEDGVGWLPGGPRFLEVRGSGWSGVPGGPGGPGFRVVRVVRASWTAAPDSSASWTSGSPIAPGVPGGPLLASSRSKPTAPRRPIAPGVPGGPLLASSRSKPTAPRRPIAPGVPGGPLLGCQGAGVSAPIGRSPAVAETFFGQAFVPNRGARTLQWQTRARAWWRLRRRAARIGGDLTVSSAGRGEV